MFFPTNRSIEVPEIGMVNFVKSKKYKRITIRVTAKKVRVSIPYRIQFNKAEEFLFKNIEWVKNKYKELSKDICISDNQVIQTLFGKIVLHFTEEKKKIIKKENELHCFLPHIAENKINQKEMNNFLLKIIKKEAKKYLSERIKYLSEKHTLQYSKIKLSSALGRWGSCSAKNSISLNYRLIYLPTELCDYVIKHELAHTIHKNHSKSFWEFLEKLDPHYKEHRKDMKKYNICTML